MKETLSLDYCVPRPAGQATEPSLGPGTATVMGIMSRITLGGPGLSWPREIRMMSGVLLNGALLLNLLLAGAQPARDAAGTLAGAKTVKCDFTVYAVASWKDGTAQAEVKPSKLSFRFEEVDTDGGTARVIGPFGASDIVVRVSMDTLHFVQSFVTARCT